MKTCPIPKETAGIFINEAIQIAERENDLWAQNYDIRIQADHLRFEGRYEGALIAFKKTLHISLATEDHISAGMELANTALLVKIMEDIKASGDYANSALYLSNDRM